MFGLAAITNSYDIPSEFDWYFGYATDLWPNKSVDIGDLYYFYPGETDETQFNEYYLSLGTEIPLGMVADGFCNFTICLFSICT